MTIDDTAQIQAIMKKSKSSDYALRGLMMNFIRSDLFLKR